MNKLISTLILILAIVACKPKKNDEPIVEKPYTTDFATGFSQYDKLPEYRYWTSGYKYSKMTNDLTILDLALNYADKRSKKSENIWAMYEKPIVYKSPFTHSFVIGSEKDLHEISRIKDMYDGHIIDTKSAQLDGDNFVIKFPTLYDVHMKSELTDEGYHQGNDAKYLARLSVKHTYKVTRNGKEVIEVAYAHTSWVDIEADIYNVERKNALILNAAKGEANAWTPAYTKLENPVAKFYLTDGSLDQRYRGTIRSVFNDIKRAGGIITDSEVFVDISIERYRDRREREEVVLTEGLTLGTLDKSMAMAVILNLWL